jgi:hypothetical protein
MLAIILYLFRFVRLLGSGHQAVAVENLALRLQLAAYKRKRRRPILAQWDRWFWVGLSQVWSGWRHALIFVQPDTVVRWQRERFRRFWARLSRPKGPGRGRPAVASEIGRLIRQMAVANPLWRAPKTSWRVEDAGHHNIGTNRITYFADCSTATFSDVEDFSQESLGSDRIG